jgi:hypothetical protein
MASEATVSERLFVAVIRAKNRLKRQRDQWRDECWKARRAPADPHPAHAALLKHAAVVTDLSRWSPYVRAAQAVDRCVFCGATAQLASFPDGNGGWVTGHAHAAVHREDCTWRRARALDDEGSGW